MSDWLSVLGALAVLVLPLMLAWWLLAQRDRPRPPRKEPSSREKMTR